MFNSGNGREQKAENMKTEIWESSVGTIWDILQTHRPVKRENENSIVHFGQKLAVRTNMLSSLNKSSLCLDFITVFNDPYQKHFIFNYVKALV